MTSAAKIRFCLTAVVCLVASLFCSAQVAAPNLPLFISFQVPNSTDTYPMSVSDSLSVTGYYRDSSQHIHGFVRNSLGEITSFDVPGSLATQPVGIDEAGEIAGIYDVAPGVHRGFIRLPTGQITTFNPAGSVGSTIPTAINASGAVVGMYSTTNVVPPGFGFLRYPNGSIATFGITGSTYVNPQSINTGGEVTGQYFYDGNTQIGGFVRYPNGEITTFDYEQGIVPSGINNTGTVAGWYATTGFHGFVRSAEGELTFFDPPGTLMTQYISINRAGEVAGSYNAKTSTTPSSTLGHGFFRSGDGTIQSFDPPGSVATTPTSINTFGVVAGWYFASTGGAVGFVRMPQADCVCEEPQ
jgi:hypothetical protein